MFMFVFICSEAAKTPPSPSLLMQAFVSAYVAYIVLHQLTPERGAEIDQQISGSSKTNTSSPTQYS